MYEKYKSGIQDLLDNGYAEKVPDSNTNKSDGPIWYLPHHGVTNENKPDKLRIVFDCAAKCGEISLNEVVHQGPDLTNKLIGVLQRFRQGSIAFMGDPEAMFHQVRVIPKDRHALRFLWWPNGDMSQQPAIYRMTVHLFGGVWGPSCASYAVKRTAEDNADQFDSETIRTVKENFYVDDCLKSVETVSEANHLVRGLNELLLMGGFKLTKYISNSREVLEAIPVDLRAKGVKHIDLNSSDLPSERALGVQWNTETDEFGFKIRLRDRPCTRRGLISIISSVYDPFGFLCPVILKAKIIFQSECRMKKGWDEPLQDINREIWDAWIHGLPDVEQLKIDRCLVPSTFGEVKLCELHHLADASCDGYGSVSYLRVVNAHRQIHCAFLMGKSRLAPIKQLTIPRLELSAAVISVKLDQMLRRELRLKIDNSVFWTDSMVTLQYIKNLFKRFQTFVVNRVATIRTGSSPVDWHYAGSKLNPAGDASRGVSAKDLISSDRWKYGPDFLWCDESSWPEEPIVDDITFSDKEVKKEASIHVTGKVTPVPVTTKLIEAYSSWYRLKRCVAWLLRLKQRLRERARKTISVFNVPNAPLAVSELNTAEVEIVKYIQRLHFGVELDALIKKPSLSVKKSSSIYRLDPIINADGVLCVGGRLHAAPISEEAKHQMIIPKGCHVVTLIVRHYHQKLGHSGREHVLCHVRQGFWIIKARVAINKVLRNCEHLSSSKRTVFNIDCNIVYFDN